jgi:hypothetical protein
MQKVRIGTAATAQPARGRARSGATEIICAGFSGRGIVAGMIHFLVAFALLAHLLWWGAGLAVLAMPRPWRRFWPVLVVPAALALQSTVVWLGAYANLRGTSGYALASELVPLALLGAALARRGAAALRAEAWKFAGVWGGVVASLFLLVLPLALAAKGLTTVSLGSCDAADYAGGARTLLEFARGERAGFLGLAEVVRVHSVDNFFDYWLRLNHFTPSALIALNGAVLHCAPHELTGILTLALLAGSLPTVFWLARAVVGLRPRASLFVMALYALSPVTWYAVAQVSPGQLIAAQAIALITWVGFVLWRRLTWALAWRCAGVLAMAYALVLGAYNFIVLVCLVPAVAYAGGAALARFRVGRFIGWLAAMLAPLLACGALWWDRVAGLAERLRLLRSYDFGWKIALLTPEGWLGFVRDTGLAGYGGAWRGALSLALVAAVALALRHRARLAGRAAALTLPALIGCAYLQWRGATLGTNASYDAYKLLAVFFPGVLAVSLLWLRGLDTRWRAAALAGAALVALAHLQVYSKFFHALRSPPLRVTLELRDLRRIEAMEDVASVNVLLPDMWSRLWANAFLLRKPQYFLTHTYEARLNTPLRGEWDLLAGMVEVRPPNGVRQLTPHFTLVSARHPAFVRVLPPPVEVAAEGWHAGELAAGGAEHWRWTEGDARLRVSNPHPYPVTLAVKLDARSAVTRDIALLPAGEKPAAFATIGAERRTADLPPVQVPPGESILVLHSPQPPAHVPGDGRALGTCVFRLILEPKK